MVDDEVDDVGMDGWWRRRNLVLEGVRKREMYEVKNLSIALK